MPHYHGAAANLQQELLPFAVVGSERTVVVNGKNVRGRQNKWGIINGKPASYIWFYTSSTNTYQSRTRTTANSSTSVTSSPALTCKT